MDKENAYKQIIELQREYIKAQKRINNAYGDSADSIIDSSYAEMKEIEDEIEKIEKKLEGNQ